MMLGAGPSNAKDTKGDTPFFVEFQLLSHLHIPICNYALVGGGRCVLMPYLLVPLREGSMGSVLVWEGPVFTNWAHMGILRVKLQL